MDARALYLNTWLLFACSEWWTELFPVAVYARTRKKKKRKRKTSVCEMRALRVASGCRALPLARRLSAAASLRLLPKRSQNKAIRRLMSALQKPFSLHKWPQILSGHCWLSKSRNKKIIPKKKTAKWEFYSKQQKKVPMLIREKNASDFFFFFAPTRRDTL